MIDGPAPLSPRVPDLPSLELLVGVARLGSIGRAAVAYGISQPSASHRVRTMERLVGVPLVTRSPRGSRLTPAGTLLVEWAGAVVDAARVLDAGIDALREQRDQRLRVAASLTIAEYLLPGWLVALRRDRPGTAVSLGVENSAQVARAILDGDADLGFVEGPGPVKGLRSASVGHDELALVVGPGHRWAKRGNPLGPGELAATPLICREEGSGTRAALAAALRGHGEPAPPLLELASTTAVKAAVAAGDGAAVLSSLAVADDIAAGQLTRVPVEGVDLRRSLRAVWRTGTRPTGPAADLLALAVRGRG
ncbi:LysR substrate-binding domain-containing protein [Phytomonospora endophytica]|uniref:Molybdate transport repressor ModE-like protein n=1 Tax=Phytomonospora endophytica TaxID=714109 RepID=A0A841FHI6_9ACTN|nr:LysR substrate-binding domain-containing protein [Phytomonospora endophytica]MBB6033032.1 molybdate transport repressor ModE-like protein [Phytomonospora endophytica]GIG65259.1 transcriptional regulator [Phytomonospora endophytica]